MDIGSFRVGGTLRLAVIRDRCVGHGQGLSIHYLVHISVSSWLYNILHSKTEGARNSKYKNQLQN